MIPDIYTIHVLLLESGLIAHIMKDNIFNTKAHLFSLNVDRW